jgi:serine/threonine-protein phosphatase 6 regulatory subunit 3
MAEDVITALEHFPSDLRHIIERFAPQPAWNDYVTGRYKETKKRDTSLLGGGKPAVNVAPRAGGRWAVDEEDVKTTAVPENGGPGVKGEFKRTTTTRPNRETSADFGPAPMEDDEDHGTGPPQVFYNFLVLMSSLDPLLVFQFARYLTQELHAGEYLTSDTSDEDDDEDDGGGWLAQSRFDLGKPPPARRHNNGQSSSGFEVGVVT